MEEKPQPVNQVPRKLRDKSMETVKERCRGQRKQPIGTSGSHTWGTQSKSETGATRLRRWVYTEGTSLRGRQERDAPSAGQTRLARVQGVVS